MELAVLDKVAGKKVNRPNAESFLSALNAHGAMFGLDQPHRFVQFLAQVLHESMGFTYDREIWGPTPAQKRYDTRIDLGNTAAVDGDGKLYMGRTALQLTGKDNYRRFTLWARKFIAADAPDFILKPDLVNTDPWEGLVPLWFWSEGNSTGKSLNRFADIGDVEMITKRVNGGLNGYDDRLRYLARGSLYYCGFNPSGLAAFQKENGLVADGIFGPKTRAALHERLLKLTPGAMESPKTKIAPVTEEKAVAVTPAELDKPVAQTTGFWERLLQIGGAVGSAGAAALGDWRVVVAIAGAAIVIALVGLVLHSRIVAAVKSIKEAVEQ